MELESLANNQSDNTNNISSTNINSQPHTTGGYVDYHNLIDLQNTGGTTDTTNATTSQNTPTSSGSTGSTGSSGSTGSTGSTQTQHTPSSTISNTPGVNLSPASVRQKTLSPISLKMNFNDTNTGDVKTTTIASVSTNDISGVLDLFKQSNVILICWGLAVYLLIYTIVNIFSSPDPTTNQMLTITRAFDAFILFSLLITIIMWYTYRTDDDRKQWVNTYVGGYATYINQPQSIFFTVIFISILYASIYLIGIPMDSATKPGSVSILESGMWVTMTLILIVQFFKYVLRINLFDIFNEWWHPTPPPQQTAHDENEPSPPKEEVFNVADNMYTYEDAQTICSAYGSRLATYDEVETAYKDGAEWCNYGWSEGQMIFFPTQKATWDKLQKTKLGKNKCGRPGVNGGYVDNPYARFGVNCYGMKPKPTESDINRLKEMASSDGSTIPKTEEEEAIDMKVKYWKENGDKILRINAFNGSAWSEY